MNHAYDLENLNMHGYSYSENAQHKNNVYVMIYFEIEPCVNPEGYKLMEDAYTYADVVDCLVTVSIPVL